MTAAVNTAIVDDYTVTYNVADLAGNEAEPITRTVRITPAAGTGGGGGGATSAVLFFLLMFAAAVTAYHAKRAIITADGQKKNLRGLGNA